MLVAAAALSAASSSNQDGNSPSAEVAPLLPATAGACEGGGGGGVGDHAGGEGCAEEAEGNVEGGGNGSPFWKRLGEYQRSVLGRGRPGPNLSMDSSPVLLPHEYTK